MVQHDVMVFVRVNDQPPCSKRLYYASCCFLHKQFPIKSFNK